jgi:hypothetical protein
MKRDITILVAALGLLIASCGTAPGHGKSPTCDSTSIVCDTTMCDSVVTTTVEHSNITATDSTGTEVE